MATATNQPTMPNNDQMPDSVTNDGGEGLDLQPAQVKLEIGAGQPPQREQAEEGGDEQPKEFRDTKREAIYAKARAARAAETKEFSGDQNDADVLYGVNTNKEELSPLEQQALDRQKAVAQQRLDAVTQPQAEQPQQPAAPQKTLNGLDPVFLATKITTIVDGVPVERTVEELIRNDQMNSAAEKRFAQSTQILQSVKELQKNMANQPQPSGQQDRDPLDITQASDPNNGNGTPAQKPQFDARALAEKIQLGSTEEATEAIESLIKAVSRNQVPQDDTIRVLTVLEDRNSEEALRTIAHEFPDVINDRHMVKVVAEESQAEMLKDLHQSGLSKETLMDLIKGPNDLTDLHKLARINRAPGVRSAGDIMKAAIQTAQSWRTGRPAAPASAQPAPQPQPFAAREARKATLQTQPAARGAATTVMPARQLTQEQARSAAVQAMRKARGHSA